MLVKLVGDPFFPEGVVKELNESGHDAVHAGEIGASDLPLRDFLRLAVFEDRVVVTRNRGVARLVESAGGPWPSVIYLRQTDSFTEPDSEDGLGALLLSLLELFGEDLKDGALLIVRDSQTLLRKFVRQDRED